MTKTRLIRRAIATEKCLALSLSIMFLMISCHETLTNPLEYIRNERDLIEIIENMDIADSNLIVTSEKLYKIAKANNHFDLPLDYTSFVFSKGDFDNDGLTDIIYHESRGDYHLMPYVLYLNSNDSIIKKPILFNRPIINALGKFTERSKEQIILYKQDYTKKRLSPEFIYDTLSFDSGLFLNPSSCSENIKVASLTIETYSSWAGTIDSISVNLNNNSASLSINYVDSIIRLDNFQLSGQSVNYIRNLLPHVNICNLQKEYISYWSDADTRYIKIVTEDGDTIHFEDYGMVGPPAMVEIYRAFDKIKYNAQNTAPSSNRR